MAGAIVDMYAHGAGIRGSVDSSIIAADEIWLDNTSDIDPEYDVNNDDEDDDDDSEFLDFSSSVESLAADSPPTTAYHSTRSLASRRLSLVPPLSPDLGADDGQPPASVVARERSNIQALKRLSFHAGTTDPDMLPLLTTAGAGVNPGVGPPSQNPLGSSELTAASTPSPLGTDSSLLWVPAHMHPALAPTEWLTFVRERVAEIQRRAISRSSSGSDSDGDLDSNNVSLPPAGSPADGRVVRRKSNLSREIDTTLDCEPLGFEDGADYLQQDRSKTQAPEVTVSDLRLLESYALEVLHGEHEEEAQDGEPAPVPVQMQGLSLRRSSHALGRRSRGSSDSTVSEKRQNFVSQHSLEPRMPVTLSDPGPQLSHRGSVTIKNGALQLSLDDHDDFASLKFGDWETSDEDNESDESAQEESIPCEAETAPSDASTAKICTPPEPAKPLPDEATSNHRAGSIVVKENMLSPKANSVLPLDTPQGLPHMRSLQDLSNSSTDLPTADMEYKPSSQQQETKQPSLTERPLLTGPTLKDRGRSLTAGLGRIFSSDKKETNSMQKGFDVVRQGSMRMINKLTVPARTSSLPPDFGSLKRSETPRRRVNTNDTVESAVPHTAGQEAEYDVLPVLTSAAIPAQAQIAAPTPVPESATATGTKELGSSKLSNLFVKKMGSMAKLTPSKSSSNGKKKKSRGSASSSSSSSSTKAKTSMDQRPEVASGWSSQSPTSTLSPPPSPSYPPPPPPSSSPPSAGAPATVVPPSGQKQKRAASTVMKRKSPPQPQQPPQVPPPPGPRMMVQDYYTRFPMHVERAIYQLSHFKLANPRRPLYQQVLLSNFMYSYLELINLDSIYSMQQQQRQQEYQQRRYAPVQKQQQEIVQQAQAPQQQLQYYPQTGRQEEITYYSTEELRNEMDEYWQDTETEHDEDNESDGKENHEYGGEDMEDSKERYWTQETYFETISRHQQDQEAERKLQTAQEAQLCSSEPMTSQQGSYGYKTPMATTPMAERGHVPAVAYLRG
ncbi:uncharacterized protein V1518DRAFT_411512 [Limtongia smithiae]|uniref:uncharacterized protein n=1 Tax=Limtongia smithiae TaxID=1125753 RepID=UPI0034D0188A